MKNQRRKLGAWLVAPSLALALGGCRFEGTGTKMQWAPDMADAPTSKPQKSYLDPPEHSVPMASIIYPATVEEAEQRVAMPLEIADGSAHLEAGKELFDTFCSVCHGKDAKGEGTLGPAFPRPPDLTLAMYQEKRDGFFFYRITFGSAVMPAYGHATTPVERWQIVKYLRTLQQ